MIRLIGIDVDGTLVGASGAVDAAVWNAAQRLRERGVRLALCSGRPAFGTALDYARELDEQGWHAFQNGASIVHLGAQRSLSQHLSPRAVTALIDQARRTGRLLELYSDDAYVSETGTPWDFEHAELLGVEFTPQPYESLRGPVVRAQWLVPHASSIEVIAEAPDEVTVAQSTSPMMPQTRFIAMTPMGISKGSAMRTIAKEYGVDLHQVMYIGDVDNDLPALQSVGWPIAMANASPDVLSVARHVVGHVDAGGLVEALELALRD